jgi:hypothetical protein
MLPLVEDRLKEMFIFSRLGVFVVIGFLPLVLLTGMPQSKGQIQTDSPVENDGRTIQQANLQPTGPVVDLIKISEADREFHRQSVVPMLESFCADCHIDGAEEGGVVLDGLLSDQFDTETIKLWNRAITQMRLQLMPPIDMDQPTNQQRDQISQWVKKAIFQIDPRDPHPGRRVIGRLNRAQYRNTIFDLTGYKVDTESLFPPDDTGHGFDNISEVLTVSPLLMEKYINAATEIVNSAVPQVGRVPKTSWVSTKDFILGGDASWTSYNTPRFDYHTGGTAKVEFEIDRAANYRFEIVIVAAETYADRATDENTCRVRVACGGEVLMDAEFKRENWRHIPLELERHWEPGTYAIEIEVTPKQVAKSTRELRIQVGNTRVIGPLDISETFVRPKNYQRFFEDIELQTDAQRQQSAKRLLTRFATQAFRRPVDGDVVERLVAVAKSVWSIEGETFETGVAQAMIAVLSSPAFLFKETVAEASGDRFPLVDQHSLATQLSYFLWSTMPDERLLDLAAAGKLRANLDAEIDRMLSHKKFNAFYKNFIGQWLMTRDVMNVPINAFSVTKRRTQAEEERSLFERIKAIKSAPGERSADQTEKIESLYKQLRELYKTAKPFELTGKLRTSMRRETEMMFEYLVKTDADLIELVDSEYTFLNASLAKHYGIEGVEGDQMRRVSLKPEHQRGSLLTHGSLLTVTSNPDRTSPVKRGLFILENVLGMPTGAPPPNIPSLEEVAGGDHDGLTLRQSLALHREDPQCSSCHNRMDPLGLALENFDALGRYRSRDSGGDGEPIDASGVLITGEEFENVQDLKRLLSANHREKFYRCLTEKMMTYALGRAIDYRDTHSIDQIVAGLESSGATAKSVFKGIINSASFQRTPRDSNE